MVADYSAADSERWFPEQHSSRRSDFARDRARLLHSSALRRLAAKTQVLSPAAGLNTWVFAASRRRALECSSRARSRAKSLRRLECCSGNQRSESDAA